MQSVFPDEIGELFTVHKLPLSLAAFSLTLFIVSVVLLYKSTQMEAPLVFTEADASGSAVLLLTVDIQGAVLNPGIYSISEEERVDDVIRKAGGLTGDADTDKIARSLNRAARLTDGAKIYIPTSGEGGQDETSHNNSFATNSEANAENTGFLTQSDPSQNGSVSNGISVNIATQSELESLNGVGPVTAAKIIQNRPYSDIHQLVERKCMSESLFGKLAGQLAL